MRAGGILAARSVSATLPLPGVGEPASPEPETRHTEASVLALLAKKYAPPAYAFLPHVRNGTGFARAPRTCDGLAMGLYPSRGIDLHGFEVKVSRSDWLLELADPSKAASIGQYCDFWWVAAPAGVVRPDEMPLSWGLLCPASGGESLRVVKQAKPGPSEHVKPLDRLLVAAILRRVTEVWTPVADIEARIETRVEEQAKKAAVEQKYRMIDLENMEARVKEFEAASGLDVAHGWQSPEKIGRAVAVVLNGGLENYVREIERARDAAERLMKQADGELASLRIRLDQVPRRREDD